MPDNCKLSDKKCGPCNKETPPLSREQIQEYLLLVPHWALVPEAPMPTIKRVFRLKDFDTAVDFVNKMAAIADAEDHHPDFLLHKYRVLEVSLSTHAIGGLSENDFILAAKIDVLAP